MKIFSITGTKGKTSITRLLSFILHALGENVLRVDSEGHLVNEVKQSTFGDSIRLFGDLAPTVCPGKYLITMKDFYPAFAAVLESSISCGQEGLGYKNHQIGIFTNVYLDHINGRPGRKNQKDLARAKNFIFQKIAKNGFALFNADDKYVCSQLKIIPKEKNVTLLPVGINFSFFNLKKHLSDGGEIITLENNFVVIKSEKETKKIIAVDLIPWTFAGNYLPAIWTLLFSVGGLYAYFDKKIPPLVTNLILNYKMDPTGGRMLALENPQGVQIIFDYAHERYSLLELSRLGRKMAKKRLIGVLRLAPNNRDKEIREISRLVGGFFDEVVIYDKVDGINRQAYLEEETGFKREVGEVSALFAKNLLAIHKNLAIQRIISEEEAIKKASEIATVGDLVIAIWGDNKKRSLSYIEKYFQATFK